MGRPAILKVDIVADAKGASKGVQEAESRFSRFGSTIGKVGKAAALGLGAGLVVAAAGAVKLAQGAAEDEQAQKRLAVTLKNATGARKQDIASVEDWITKQGKALGVADDDLRPALGRLAAVTHDVGKAQSLTSLAMDISAGTGKSLETVTTALAKAQTGSLGGLSRLGVATKDQAGNALSLDQITQNLAKTYKGQASAAANTAAGRWGRLKLQFSEAGETIGGKLLPVANKLAGWALTKMLPAAGKLGASLSRNLGPAFKAVGRFITGTAVPAARQFVTWFQDKLVPGIQRYLTPVLNGARSAFRSVADSVRDNKPQLQQLLNAARTMAEFFAKHVLPLMGKAVGGAFRVAGKVIGGTITVIARLTDGVYRAVNAVRSLIGWIQSIHVPNLSGLKNLGGLVGFSSPVTVGGVQLVGRSSSFDRRGSLATAGWSTAAAAPAGLDLSRVRAAGGVTYVDDRDLSTTVKVDGAALYDPRFLSELNRALSQHQARMGQAPAYGGRR